MKSQKKLDELGILNIEASGELTSGLVLDAIESTENLFKSVDMAALAKEINDREKICGN